MSQTNILAVRVYKGIRKDGYLLPLSSYLRSNVDLMVYYVNDYSVRYQNKWISCNVLLKIEAKANSSLCLSYKAKVYI